jgi:hypothetical protein
LNFADKQMVGFVSSHDTRTQQKGRVEVLPEPA